MRQVALSRLLKSSLASLILFAVSACGGGGGGSDSSGGSGSAGSGGGGSTAQPVAQTEAARFLVQASFGPTEATIEDTSSMGLEAYFLQQIGRTPTYYLPRLRVQATTGADQSRNAATHMFWEAAVSAPDQLRQRMVYALSQIIVVSINNEATRGNPLMMAYYMDQLSNNAFGNYRDLLEDVTYSPAMSHYLTYYRNKKGDMSKGSVPDENYAREIMQLFTIGLIELNADGTSKSGEPETYTNEDVIGLARVFTGLSYKGTNFWTADEDGAYSRLVPFEEFHSPLEKSFLGLTIPAGTDATTSITMALDHLFAHPNVAPFISRQLIQRFTTSHPSPAYVSRVAAAFETGSYQLPSGRRVGEGLRGDLTATLAAILFDEEARQDPSLTSNSFGKVKEPVLRLTHWARAFNIKDDSASSIRWFDDNNMNDRIGQSPFASPSVFNFYRPQFIAPSTETGEANLTAPELQIVNEASSTGYINTMSDFIRDTVPSRDGNELAFSPDYSEELALAETPQSLVDHLNLLLTYGEMTTATQNRIVSMLNEIPIRTEFADQDRATRVHFAILMAMTAPEFLVQR